MQPDPRLRHDLTLLMVFVLVVVVSGFSPHSRVDWALENLLVLLLVGMLVAVTRRFRLSAVAADVTARVLAVFRDPEHHAVDIGLVRADGLDRRGFPGQRHGEGLRRCAKRSLGLAKGHGHRGCRCVCQPVAGLFAGHGAKATGDDCKVIGWTASAGQLSRSVDRFRF